MLHKSFLSIALWSGILFLSNANNPQKSNDDKLRIQSIRNLTTLTIRYIDVRNFYQAKKQLNELMPLLEDELQINVKTLKKYKKEKGVKFDAQKARVQEIVERIDHLHRLYKTSAAAMRVNGKRISETLDKLNEIIE